MNEHSHDRKRITQADVARRANVSQAMVSYIVNDNTTISIPEETRQRILTAMDELGYVPNVMARRLQSSKTLTVAGIIPDIINPFYPLFERGIQDVTDQHDYDLIMYNTDGCKNKEQKYLQSLLQGRVDGLIGVFFHLSVKDLLPLIEQNLFVVRLEAKYKKQGHLPIDNVYVDNIAAATTATNYLISKGHKNIGMLTSNDGPAQCRELGYREALEKHHIPIDKRKIRGGSYNENGGYQAMHELIRQNVPLSAIFAANDLMAMGAMVAIREAGLTIPDDIAVVGFDDITSAKLVFPGLTTIAQPQRQMGQRAAEMLFERLNGTVAEAGRSEEIPYKLIIRESA
jgi:LacI family transcriptional regulator